MSLFKHIKGKLAGQRIEPHSIQIFVFSNIYGWITTTPGAVVDYEYIKTHIRNMEKDHKFKIKEICADPWNATQFMQDMEAEGYVMIEIRQGMAILSGPTKDFREQVYQKKEQQKELIR